MPASSIVEYLALIPGDWHPHDFCLIVTKCREFVIVTVEALNLKSNNFFRVETWEFESTDFYEAQYSSRNHYRYSLI